MPIISIIVPIYNVEKYLERCIDSILKQTFTKFELLLVNDGSTDNCGKICDLYAKKDSRIKVIHQENGGLSDARNKGLDMAKGEYIGFVDSDDYIHKDMFKIMYETIIDSKCDIVQCEFKMFNEFNEIIEKDCDYKNYQIYEKQVAIKSLIYNEKFNVNTWNKLYHKKLFKNIRFPKGKIHEDEFTTYKLFYNSDKIAYVDNILYYYLQNNEGIMRGSNLLKRFDRIEALEERTCFLLNINEYELYEDSLFILFLTLIKLKFLLSRNNSIENKNYYYEIIKTKILEVVDDLKENRSISKFNIICIRLIDLNYSFIKIYDIYNYLFSLKYRFKYKVKNK